MVTECVINHGIDGVIRQVELALGVKGTMIYLLGLSKKDQTLVLTLDDIPPITSQAEGDAVWLDYSGKNKRVIDRLIQAGYLKEMYQEKFINHRRGTAYLLTSKWLQPQVA